MPRLEGKDNSGARWAIGLIVALALGGGAYFALGRPPASRETIDTNIARPMPPRGPEVGDSAANNANTALSEGGSVANATPGVPPVPNAAVPGATPGLQDNAFNPAANAASGPVGPTNSAASPTPFGGEMPAVNPDAPNVPNGSPPGGANMQNVPPPPGVATRSGDNAGSTGSQ